MTPSEIRSLREGLGLSVQEFGEALGLADASRTIRAWEHGERNGKSHGPVGTGLAAMRYLEAILSVLRKCEYELDEAGFHEVTMRLRSSLPECLKGVRLGS